MQRGGAGNRDLGMGRDHDDAAAPPMIRDGFLKLADAGPVERHRRLVEQPERRRCREDAGKVQPPLLPRRQVAPRNIGDMRHAQPLQGRHGRLPWDRRLPPSTPRRQGSRAPKAPASRRRDARHSGRGCGAGRDRTETGSPSQLMPPEKGRSNPAIMRSRLDLPLPLGPSSTRAPPASTANDSPWNTSRSPRRQVRSLAAKRGIRAGLSARALAGCMIDVPWYSTVRHLPRLYRVPSISAAPKRFSASTDRKWHPGWARRDGVRPLIEIVVAGGIDAIDDGLRNCAMTAPELAQQRLGPASGLSLKDAFKLALVEDVGEEGMGLRCRTR